MDPAALKPSAQQIIDHYYLSWLALPDSAHMAETMAWWIMYDAHCCRRKSLSVRYVSETGSFALIAIIKNDHILLSYQGPVSRVHNANKNFTPATTEHQYIYPTMPCFSHVC